MFEGLPAYKCSEEKRKLRNMFKMVKTKKESQIEILFFIIHNVNYQSPNVATITALIVCIRFSASSNTIEFSDSKTSPDFVIASPKNFH